MAFILQGLVEKRMGQMVNCSGDLLAHTEQGCELVDTPVTTGRDAADPVCAPLSHMRLGVTG